MTSPVLLKVPSSEEFTQTYQKAQKEQVDNELLRKSFNAEQRTAYQISSIEKAFAQRDPKIDQVEVLIDGYRTPFELAVEEALSKLGYSVSYSVDRDNDPNQSLATIYVKHQSTESTAFKALAMMLLSGLVSPEGLFDILVNDDLRRDVATTNNTRTTAADNTSTATNNTSTTTSSNTDTTAATGAVPPPTPLAAPFALETPTSSKPVKCNHCGKDHTKFF